jgi:hypothetical protein
MLNILGVPSVCSFRYYDQVGNKLNLKIIGNLKMENTTSYICILVNRRKVFSLKPSHISKLAVML